MRHYLKLVHELPATACNRECDLVLAASSNLLGGHAIVSHRVRHYRSLLCYPTKVSVGGAASTAQEGGHLVDGKATRLDEGALADGLAQRAPGTNLLVTP